MNLLKKSYIITGASSGLGNATARQFLLQGASVALFDLNAQLGEKSVHDLSRLITENDLPGSVDFFEVNVTDETQVILAVEKARLSIGDLHGCVNCAGIGAAKSVYSRKRSHPLGLFQKVINVNLVGTFNVLKATVESMVKHTCVDKDGHRGVIINTASIAAYDGQNGQAAYAASKGGIVAMTLPLARELARYGIRVVSIAPGIFDTPMMAAVPEKARKQLARLVPFPSRFGRPSEFGQFCTTVASTQMLNGEVIRLDGALRMPKL